MGFINFGNDQDIILDELDISEFIIWGVGNILIMVIGSIIDGI